jgi:hypothetical protein
MLPGADLTLTTGPTGRGVTGGDGSICNLLMLGVGIIKFVKGRLSLLYSFRNIAITSQFITNFHIFLAF